MQYESNPTNGFRDIVRKRNTDARPDMVMTMSPASTSWAGDKKDRSGFVMICDTTCGYCRKEVISAHGIEAVYMYFNGSGI